MPFQLHTYGDELALALSVDVLVIGGGLSGAWAAIGAAESGASVILADKGYLGTSGVTAKAGPGHWWAAPGDRAEAIARKWPSTAGLADPHWMERILDLTYTSLPRLSPFYRFPTDDHGQPRYKALRGPEYLRAMRAFVLSRGITVLDQSPAIELLAQADGAIAGARGLRRQEGRHWTVRAGATVLATGGAGFRSELLGCKTNTGDGHLMAAEVGAEFSGMEFGCYYTIAADGSTMTRSMSYAFAQYFDAAGREIHIPPGSENSRDLARALLEGPVFCSLAQMPDSVRESLARIQPNFALPFQRSGVDPFRDRFQITLHGEGTIRGNGGVRVVKPSCATSVENLFVAGDVASRELVAGAASGGGAINSAWAVSSGQWAGRGAAERAKANGQRIDEPVEATGAAGLRPRQQVLPLPRQEITKAVQTYLLGYDTNVFRTEAKLQKSVAILDDYWMDIRDHLAPTSFRDIQDARETAALVATGRLVHGSALQRKESRGVHQRDDIPETDANFDAHLIASGLDTIAWRKEGLTQAVTKEIAA